MRTSVVSWRFCIIMIICLLQVSQVVSAGNTHPEDDETLRNFIGAIKDSIVSKNQDDFVSLHYYSSQTNSQIKESDKEIYAILTKPNTKIRDITFVPLTRDINKGWIADCREFKPTLTVIGYIKIDYERDIGKAKEEAGIKIPIGERDGKYRFASASVRPVDEEAPNSYVVSVSGGSAFEGYCLVTSAEGDIRKNLSGSNSNILRFCGKLVRECKVHPIYADGIIDLQIFENGEVLFSSKSIRGGEAVLFENKQ